MARTVMIEAVYPRDADTVFRNAIDLKEMQAAMSQVATYKGLPDRKIVEGDRFEVDVTFFGLLKSRGHVMRVERLDPVARVVQSREHNPSVKTWDHRLTVEPQGDAALWRDVIEVEAGWRTPFVAWLCKYLYTHRHKARRGQGIKAAMTR